jgi:hypothetical protein
MLDSDLPKQARIAAEALENRADKEIGHVAFYD